MHNFVFNMSAILTAFEILFYIGLFLLATSWLIGLASKTLFFAQAKLLDPENNRLCATATGTYKRQERQSEVPVG